MDQYDICRNVNPSSKKLVPYVVVLQANLLSDFATVIVAPLMLESVANKISRLNPVVKLQDKKFRVSMAEMSSILRKELGETVANVKDQHVEFVAAIDLLFTGI